MDWNKTKTIFIIVFSIVNVFLYTLYLNKVTQAQNVQVLGETPIEELLKMENITYDKLPPFKNEPFYVSAKPMVLSDAKLAELENQKGEVVDETLLKSTLIEPFSLLNVKGEIEFTEFLSKHVMGGESYVQWEVNKDERKAILFQEVDGDPIYHSLNAMLIIYWNEDGEATEYEQSMLGEFDRFNRKNDLLSPIEAIDNLYSRGYLKKNYKVKQMTLGYSSLVQVTETQVFAPTWHVRVELKDGEIEDYFINAIEGMIIEFQPEPLEEENE